MGDFDTTRRRSCSPSWCSGAISISILGIIVTIAMLLCASLSAGTDHIGSAKAKYNILSRKLLGREEAHRKCRKEDIGIYQIATSPLYDGIPTYRVEIVNECASGCAISHIHLFCEWFSSASLVNPNTFKRLHYNDCLVNHGNPLAFGSTLSFQYANTYSYPLSVSSLRCS